MDKRKFLFEVFIPLLHKRFEEKWPDCFVVARSTDPEEAKRANGNPYSFYIACSNALFDFRDSELEQRFEGFRDAADWLTWTVENLRFKF